jgi:flagellar hook-associated protein 1 FlgK
MSLTAALNVGRTGLNASQIGIQVAGNNMANAATPGYSRQIARLNPLRGGGAVPQISIGAGVVVSSIERQVDRAMQERLWATGSDQAGANALLSLYSQVESILGELGDNDFSSQLTQFFRSWSERANQTQSSAAVVQEGEKLASFVRRVNSDLVRQRGQIDEQLSGMVAQANSIIEQIASMNQAISDAEVNGQPANVLRDSRDQLVTNLSEILPVNVVDRGREGMDVLIGSIPVVLGSQARGMELRRVTTPEGDLDVSVVTRNDGSRLDIQSGSIGALLASRGGVVEDVIGQLDNVTQQLIWEVNKLHSTGTTTAGYQSLSGTQAVALADRTRAINDPLNATFGALPFSASNGGFVVRVKQNTTGAITERRIDVDLDGVTNAGVAGTTDDTTVTQIVAGLDAVEGIRARFNAQGQVEITAEEGFSFNFQDDSSGVLAALGVNAFFTGTNAATIGVRSDLATDPTRLASGRIVEGQLVENGTALGIARLQSESTGLGAAIPEIWRQTVQRVSASVAQATSAAQAAGVVRESLESQVAAVSGVSIDEESVNLLQFQRQYQASARLISVVDEMTQTLISLI